MKEQETKIIIFKTDDEKISVDAHFDEETVWLTIDDMARLFEKSRSTINEHIINVYAEGELEEAISKRKIGISDFSTKPTNFYNLDVIIYHRGRFVHRSRTFGENKSDSRPVALRPLKTNHAQMFKQNLHANQD